MSLMSNPTLPLEKFRQNLTSQSKSPSMFLRKTYVVELGGISYWLKDIQYRLSHSIDDTEIDIVPAVVVHKNDSVTADFLRKKFQEFADTDDVFIPEFANNGFIYVPSAEPLVTTDLENFIVQSIPSTPTLPEGPYFIINNWVYQAWRLYEDTLGAFVSATVPAEKDKYGFRPLPAGGSEFHKVVAVPSRLMFPKSLQKPLNGMRLSVKDIFHMKGMKTTIGSRAYTECYEPQQNTSVYLQSLIDKGAIIVGKTKTSAFAASEIPPDKCIDYFPPWSPRADGYQGPSGSSSGAGVSIAGYEWLDISIGSDTCGSIRMPASSHGLWAVRQTVNSVSWDGIVPSVEMWDAAGVIGRSPGDITGVLEASLYPEILNKAVKSPTTILYPTDWFPQADQEQQEMTEQFLAILENYLGIKHTKISLADKWKMSPPEEAQGKSVEEYLAMSWYHLQFYDSYHNMDSFRNEYREKFGKEPYVSPSQLERWDNGKKITPEERNQAVHTLDIFHQWIESNIFASSPEGAPETIMLLPLGRARANYRDTPTKPAYGLAGAIYRDIPPQQELPPPTLADLTAYDPILFSSVLGVPQIVVPIGQNPFISRNSGQKCYVPIVASLTSSAGTELQLLNIAEKAMKQAGWPTTVLTGPLAFPVGDNKRNVGD